MAVKIREKPSYFWFNISQVDIGCIFDIKVGEHKKS